MSTTHLISIRDRRPRKGQRVVLHGVHVADATPQPGGGRVVDVLGVVRGYLLVQGTTSDVTFVSIDGEAAWEPYRP